VQQILENLIAPRILGSFTGLNPVWILISVLTGARIGGLLGVIVAVPCAVVIKSIISAIRPSALSLDPEDSSLDDIATPMTPEASPKVETNNSLSVS
jgi:predicted PurR-regulated permease PerM